MGLAATIVWEVRTTGNDDNGGGYKSDAGTTDYTDQDAAELTLTDLACAIASTTLTSVTGGFTAQMVGSIIQIKSGTNFTAGFYEIKTYTSGNEVTIDRTACDGVGNGSSGTGSVGGALASPGGAVLAANVSGHKVWIKAGTYTCTTTTPGKAGPAVANFTIATEGYTTNRGDRAGRPVLDAGAQNTFTLFSSTGGYAPTWVHLKADGNSQAAVVGFNVSAGRRVVFDCEAVDCTTGFVGVASTLGIHNCGTTGCTTGFSGQAILCSAIGGTTGFTGGYQQVLCLAHGCGGDGFVLNGTSRQAISCIADGCGGDGFNVNSIGAGATSCLATNNTGYGFNTGTSSHLLTCASYNNTSGRRNGVPVVDVSAITLSADPYVALGSDDFRPNDTAGGGADIRSAGVGPFGQTNNTDVGAVQHTDPAGGGGLLVHPGTSGGARG